MTSTSKRGEAEIDGLEENEAKAYDTFKGNTMIQNAQLNEKKNEFRTFIDKYPDMRAFESVQRMEVLMDYYDKLIYAVGKELEYLKMLLVKRLSNKEIVNPVKGISPITTEQDVTLIDSTPINAAIKEQFTKVAKKLGMVKPKTMNPWSMHISKIKRENPYIPFKEVIEKKKHQ